MVTDINYVIYSIIGAIVLPLQYYFSKNKQYKLCALIPTMPILGLLGLFMLIFYNGNINKYINKYIKNHIAFLICTISLYISLIFIYYLTNNIVLSLVLAILIWSCIVYNVLNFKF